MSVSLLTQVIRNLNVVQSNTDGITQDETTTYIDKNLTVTGSTEVDALTVNGSFINNGSLTNNGDTIINSNKIQLGKTQTYFTKIGGCQQSNNINLSVPSNTSNTLNANYTGGGGLFIGGDTGNAVKSNNNFVTAVGWNCLNNEQGVFHSPIQSIFFGPTIGYNSNNGSGMGITGSNNTIFGSASNQDPSGLPACFNLTSGSSNTMFGCRVGTHLTTGSNNIFIGDYVGTALTTGSNNTLIGTNVSNMLTTGSNNFVSGLGVGIEITTGSQNMLIGNTCGTSLTTGNQNTSIGHYTSQNLTTGTNNICVGYLAGTGTNSVINLTNQSNIACYGNINIQQSFVSGQTVTLGNAVVNGSNNSSASSFMFGINQTDQQIGVNTLLTTFDIDGNTCDLIALQPGVEWLPIRINAADGASGNIVLGAGVANQTTIIQSGKIQLGITDSYFTRLGGSPASNTINLSVPSNTSNSLNNNYNGGGGLFIGGDSGDAVKSSNNFVTAIGWNCLNSGQGVFHSPIQSVFFGPTIGYGSNNGSGLGITGANNTVFTSASNQDPTGLPACYNLTSGYSNTMFGSRVGTNLTTGAYNIMIGDYVGTALTNGIANTLIGGYQTGQSLTTGNWNTLVGQGTGCSITTGDANTLIGQNTGALLTGTYNTMLGAGAGLSLVDGSDNIFVGYLSGQRITSGNTNIFIGDQTAINSTSGNNNICLGYQAGTSNFPVNLTTESDYMCIGNLDTAQTFITGQTITLGNAVNGIVNSSSISSFVFGQDPSGFRSGGNTMVSTFNNTSNVLDIYAVEPNQQWLPLRLNGIGGNAGVTIGSNSCQVDSYNTTLNGTTFINGGASMSTSTSSASGLGIYWNHVSGTGETDYLNFAQGGQGGHFFYSVNSSMSPKLLAAITQNGGFTCEGTINAVAFTPLSDERDKTNIKSLDVNGLSFISKLKPKVYNLNQRSKYTEEDVDKLSKTDPNVSIGFIAQEVQKLEEELGLENNVIVSKMSEHFGPDTLGLQETKLIPILVKAIQELIELIPQAKNKLK
jgi:hypothetical protein